MDATNEAMTRLQAAVDMRIQKENEFIRRMAEKFREIKERLQQAVSGRQEIEALLQPHIRELGAATDKLETQAPMADIEDAVRMVDSDSEPTQNPNAFTPGENDNADESSEGRLGGRRRSKRRRKRRQTKRK